MKNNIITYLILLTSVFCLSLHAQMEERGLTRDGNDYLEDSLFVMAEAEYLKSLDIHDFDTNRFNMAFAMLGQEKFEDAIAEWESVEKSSDNKMLKSFCVYNIGGALAMQQKTDEALEKYKQALRYFPKNNVARHNYWFLKLIKDQNPQQQQNEDQENKDNKDQENKDQQDQDQDNQDQQNKDQDKSDQEDSKDGDKKEDSKDGESEDEKSEDEESEDEKEKDGESDEESEDEKSDEEKDGDKSDEESEEDADDKKDENGESDEEQDGEEGDSEGEEVKEGELSTGDALRLLESLDKEEDKTQEKIKAKLLKGKKKKKHEKDW